MKEKKRPDGIFYDAIKMADCQCFFPKRWKFRNAKFMCHLYGNFKIKQLELYSLKICMISKKQKKNNDIFFVEFSQDFDNDFLKVVLFPSVWRKNEKFVRKFVYLKGSLAKSARRPSPFFLNTYTSNRLNWG